MPEPNKQLLSLDLLEDKHDFAVRSSATPQIDLIYKKLEEKKWDEDGDPIIVNKVKDSEKYFVLNGIHRFLAMIKFNQKVEPSKRIATVNCLVYKDLTYDQSLMITVRSSSKSPHFEITVLQMVGKLY